MSMFWTLNIILFLIINDTRASNYYYKQVNGNYDVYYGPRADRGYNEFKPPKSYKVNHDERGDRPGKCIKGEFECTQPYPIQQTKFFECEVDYQCPRFFKCCQIKCFQHKICQPIDTEEIDDNEVPADEESTDTTLEVSVTDESTNPKTLSTTYDPTTDSTESSSITSISSLRTSTPEATTTTEDGNDVDKTTQASSTFSTESSLVSSETTQTLEVKYTTRASPEDLSSKLTFPITTLDSNPQSTSTSTVIRSKTTTSTRAPAATTKYSPSTIITEGTTDDSIFEDDSTSVTHITTKIIDTTLTPGISSAQSDSPTTDITTVKYKTSELTTDLTDIETTVIKTSASPSTTSSTSTSVTKSVTEDPTSAESIKTSNKISTSSESPTKLTTEQTIPTLSPLPETTKSGNDVSLDDTTTETAAVYTTSAKYSEASEQSTKFQTTQSEWPSLSTSGKQTTDVDVTNDDEDLTFSGDSDLSSTDKESTTAEASTRDIFTSSTSSETSELRSSPSEGVTSTPILSTVRESTHLTDISDDEDLTFSGDFELTTTNINPVSTTEGRTTKLPDSPTLEHKTITDEEVTTELLATKEGPSSTTGRTFTSTFKTTQLLSTSTSTGTTKANTLDIVTKPQVTSPKSSEYPDVSTKTSTLLIEQSTNSPLDDTQPTSQLPLSTSEEQTTFTKDLELRTTRKIEKSTTAATTTKSNDYSNAETSTSANIIEHSTTSTSQVKSSTEFTQLSTSKSELDYPQTTAQLPLTTTGKQTTFLTDLTSDDEDITFSGDFEISTTNEEPTSTTGENDVKNTSPFKTTEYSSNPTREENTKTSNKYIVTEPEVTTSSKFSEVPELSTGTGSTSFTELSTSKFPLDYVQTTIQSTISTVGKETTGITDITNDDEDFTYSGDFEFNTIDNDMHTKSTIIDNKSTRAQSSTTDVRQSDTTTPISTSADIRKEETSPDLLTTTGASVTYSTTKSDRTTTFIPEKTSSEMNNWSTTSNSQTVTKSDITTSILTTTSHISITSSDIITDDEDLTFSGDGSTEVTNDNKVSETPTSQTETEVNEVTVTNNDFSFSALTTISEGPENSETTVIPSTLQISDDKKSSTAEQLVKTTSSVSDKISTEIITTDLTYGDDDDSMSTLISHIQTLSSTISGISQTVTTNNDIIITEISQPSQNTPESSIKVTPHIISSSVKSIPTQRTKQSTAALIKTESTETVLNYETVTPSSHIGFNDKIFIIDDLLGTLRNLPTVYETARSSTNYYYNSFLGFFNKISNLLENVNSTVYDTSEQEVAIPKIRSYENINDVVNSFSIEDDKDFEHNSEEKATKLPTKKKYIEDIVSVEN